MIANLVVNAKTMLADARSRTDNLFGLVAAEGLYERPIAERHRPIFYLGHLEAFDWNLLRPNMRHAPAFDERFDRLFAFGIALFALASIGCKVPEPVPPVERRRSD